MQWLIWCGALAAYGQSFQASPAVAPQGGVVRLRAPDAAVAARLNGRTVPLFADEEGRAGLMPVPALQPPGSFELEFLDASGAVLAHRPVRVRDARFPRQNIVLGKAEAALKPAPGELEMAEAFRQTVSAVRFWREPFLAPAPGCRTSPFGVRRYYNGKPSSNYHGGVDQRGAAGAPVRAIAAGVVRVVQPWAVHGYTVGVDHGQGVVSMYLHLSRFAVAEGAQVKPGDVVGYVGSTGRSTAPHLHWSLYIHGVAVNPEAWVRLAVCGEPLAAKPQPAARRGTRATTPLRAYN